MGDKVEFTPEEKVILGEAPEEPVDEKAPESHAEEKAAETEQKPAQEGEASAIDDLLEAEPEKEAETDEEDIPEDGKVPYSRFSKVYGKQKEIERKFDLFKRDPEAYYRLYPDEKPDKVQGQDRAEQQKPSKTISLDNLDSLMVQGGIYDGLSLADVRQRDPAAAAQLESSYLRQNLPEIVKSQVQEALKATEEAKSFERLQKESMVEIDTFRDERAKEFFKKPFEKLSEIEQKKVTKLAEQCVSWGKQTGRGGGRMEDIYFLMTRDRQLVKAKVAGADALIDAATRGGKVKSIKTGGGDGAAGSGFDKILDMTKDQAADYISNMPDKQFAKLMKEGSSDLRAKHPGWPWS